MRNHQRSRENCSCQDNMEPTNVIQFPQLNQPSPDFNALTTDGMKSLADYKGKWLVLFSHPEPYRVWRPSDIVSSSPALTPYKP